MREWWVESLSNWNIRGIDQHGDILGYFKVYNAIYNSKKWFGVCLKTWYTMKCTFFLQETWCLLLIQHQISVTKFSAKPTSNFGGLGEHFCLIARNKRLILLFFIIPHNFVWGSCFWFCIPPPPPASSAAASSRLLLHTLFTHTLSTHTLSTHTLSTHSLSTHSLSTHSLSTHTLSTHTLSTHSLSTHSLSTHSLSTHTLSTHTLSTHTLSTHTLSTHSLSTHTLSTHTLSTHTLSTHCQHTLCPHTLCPHTLCQHTLCQHTLCHTHFVKTHTHTHIRFAWQAWDRWYWVARLVDIHLRFTWQAWDKTRIHCRFAWQAWHSWYWVARLVRICRLWRRATLRGRRGTWWHPPSIHVAGVAQTRINCRFAWQAWDRWHWVARLVRICRLWRRGTLRGRRGTWWHPLSIHVAGVGQTRINCRFAWQAWDRWHWVARLVRICRLWRRATLRGRRGTWWHPPSIHVAGVAQTRINCRFAWQAWDRWHWVARLVRICRLWRRGTLRGRRGTWWHPLSIHVAGVGQTRINCRFAWQAWDMYWVARLVRICRLWRRATLRGRRGTWWHPPSIHVAGVAQTRINCRFAWQAWDRWYWVARLVRICRLWRRGTLRGRRGTWWHPPSIHVHQLSFCVAGVGQMALGGALGPDLSPVTPRHFAWQAWHLVTSTFDSRGRCGTNSHQLSFCVAGVGQMALGGALGPDLSPVTPRHFAWQAWHLVTSTFVSRGRRGTWWHSPWFHVRGTIAHPRSFCVAGVAPALTHLLSHTALSHTIFHTQSFTPNFVTHHLSRTIFHTPHCHPPSLTHHLSHTTLSHTIFDTPSFTHHLCNTPSFTHDLLHPTLSNTIFDTPISHTALSHTTVSHHLSPHHLPHTIFHHPIFHTTLSHTIFDTPSFTHHFVTHRLSHTTLSHALFHTGLSPTPSFSTPSFTHRFVTHHLSAHHPSHTTLSHTIFRHTIFHTPLCHTHHLSHTTFTHTIFHTHYLSHTALSHTHTHHLSSSHTHTHTIFHIPLCHSQLF